ncbi:MAG TPA: tol-pal system-associated acyl-CoA thioesterase [Amaricoccus sp.]|nr:tol-pal system-associated acyl-CoA thioesterase [Amaricoccus sp.]
MSYDFRLRVYYEDTDAGGIVYYANYLKFAERARSEALIALGISQQAMLETHGIGFAVRRVSVDYLAPARLEDQLLVTTQVGEIGGGRIELGQAVWRDATCLAKIRVLLVCFGRSGRAVRIPAAVREAIGRLPPLDEAP